MNDLSSSNSHLNGALKNGAAQAETIEIKGDKAQYLTVGDIVRRSERQGTDNDVQLGLYDEQDGRLEAAQSYIFTAQSVANKFSSLAIFEQVRANFLSSTPNRHVVVATYGHGKSHLAVALASFFGGLKNAPEVLCLLEGMENVAPTRAANFRTFKAGFGAALVLRLNGSASATLTDQVVKGLETALREHELTRGSDLGFWFETALRVLDEMTPTETGKANAFLVSQKTDVAALRDRISQRDAAQYEICAQTIAAAKGVRPDFGGTIELKELVQRVADDFCGEGKPFSGLLILFDEFNAFIKKYAELPAFAAGSPLQNLLDGVKNRLGKVVFMAFSQYEPEMTARLSLNRQSADAEKSESLIKELNRLPRDQHYQLYSSVELVLDAYLRQDEKAWEELNSDPHISDAVSDSYDVVLRLFSERYSRAQNWNDEDVYRVLAKGCFPLHPLTTAILCASNLREVAETRTLLGFVKAQLEPLLSQLAIQNGAPNWVNAVALVDWFGEALTENEDEWRQYKSAMRNARADTTDVPQSHGLVLRAMMLHSAARLKVGRGGEDFEKNIAALSGLPKNTVKTALGELASGGFIKTSSDGNGVFTFWPLGEDGSKVERELNKAVDAIALDSARRRSELLEATKQWPLPKIEVSHLTGEQTDWAAKAVWVPRALWNAEHLRTLIEKPRLNPNKGLIADAPRGFVFYAVATNDDDVRWFQEQSKAVLDETLATLGEYPPPVVLALPTHAQSNFLNLLLRHRVLDVWKIDRNKIQQLGEQAFSEARKTTEEAISKTLSDLQKSEEFEVPQPYRAGVSNRHVPGHKRSVGKVLEHTYELAYQKGAPGFFTQYKRETANLKKAVMLAVTHLQDNSMSGFDRAATNMGVAKELRAKFLQPGTKDNWGIIDMNGRVREPQNAHMLQAWRALDDAIPAGELETPIKNVLVQLLNAPYGYDSNTLSLLFSAWFGLNAHALKLSNFSGKPLDVEELPTTSPKDFLDGLCFTQDVRIVRRDEEKLSADVDTLIERERMKEAFSVDEAQSAIANLIEYSKGEHSDSGKKKRAADTAARLENDVAAARAYADFIAKLSGEVGTVSQIEAALKLLPEFGNAPHLGIVTGENIASLPELKAQLMQKMHGLAQSFCEKETALRSIENYGLQHERLETKCKLFRSMGETELVAIVENAMNVLGARRSELSDASKDSDFVGRLKNWRRETRLADLRSGLREIDAYPPHVDATRNLMDEVRAVVQNAIDDAESQVANWQMRLPLAITASEVKRLESAVQGRLERYENTVEYDVLDALKNRCAAIEKIFDKFSELRREKPSDTKELDKVVRKIGLLRDDENLSDEQRKIADETRLQVEERVRQNIEEAEHWLREAERQHQNNDDAVRLMIDLERGRDFLPDEHKTRLRDLKKGVQKRIDGDEIKRVEASFRNIKDKSKRAECLQLLQAIVDER